MHTEVDWGTDPVAGIGLDGAVGDEEGSEDGEGIRERFGQGEVPTDWDDMFMGSYFNVMGFFFKLNAMRLDQRQVPKAIALLCTLYILVAFYVLHIIMAVMMIYVGSKYKDKY